jgi:hypothetical protein
MDDKFKYRITSANSTNAIVEDINTKVNLSSSKLELPFNDINRIINVAEQFDLERQSSTRYRLLGTIRTLFTNALFNISGNDSYSTFNLASFRDQNYPPNSVVTEEDDLTYRESINIHLKEIDGWFGYFNPDITNQNDRCKFFEMSPTSDDFSLVNPDQRNWEITITYPALSASTQGDIVHNGLLIINSQTVTIGNRVMVALTTPVKHGLSQGDTVRINGFLTSSLDGDYTVIRRGLDDGSEIENTFVIDLDATLVNLTNNTRMKRVFAGTESDYYFRIFKKIKTIDLPEITNNNYDLYRAAFSQNLYNDIIYQFVINSDIDVSDLSDNLNRPLSELYLTIIKTDSDGLFTPINSGLDLNFNQSIFNFNSIPDIRRIHNGVNTPFTSHTPLETNITISGNTFYGDVVEYNKFELKEKVLATVNHSFNTHNRESGYTINIDPQLPQLDLGERYEGYIYQPHHLIKIRDFSNYIEQGDETTEGIPDYAEDLNDGRFIWRDLLDIGSNDFREDVLDYPFLNGSHYIHTNFYLNLRRQDPFNLYGLYYSDFPRDPFGQLMSDRFEVNRSEDVC